MNKDLTPEQNAVSVLIQVSKLAQAKGILSLEDAAIVLQSVTYLESTCLKEVKETAEPKTEPKVEPKSEQPKQ